MMVTCRPEKVPSHPFMSPPRVFKITGEAALRLLRLTYTSTDVFPLLKEAAGGVLQIVETASVRQLNSKSAD